MSDEHTDATFRDLQAELTVTPSPEFAAKVRARVAGDREREWLVGWRVAIASATVLAGAVVAVVMWRGGPVVPDTAPLSVGSGAASVANSEPSRPAIAGPVAAPVVIPTRKAPAARHEVAAVRTAVPAEPEVLAQLDQAAAISRYMAALRPGQFTGVAGAAPVEEGAREVVAPKLIEIPLIVVDLLPGTPDVRGGGRKNP